MTGRIAMLAVLMALGSVAGLAGQSGPVAARDGCLSVARFRDGDVTRNAAVLRPGSGLCLSRIRLREGRLSWDITLIDNTRNLSGPTIYLLHDNEDQAFDAALYGVRKYGGRLVAIEAGDRRDFMGQNPNRNFGTTIAATATCRDMRARPAPTFTARLLDLRGKTPHFVLTLHNNADGHSGEGGIGGISAARRSAAMTGLPAPAGGDEDDAILLAGLRPLGADRTVQRAVAALHQLGLNVIYEHVLPDRNDCSLSNYIVLNAIAPYYNIEAQHGHLDRQKAMLDALMRFHGITPRNPSVR